MIQLLPNPPKYTLIPCYLLHISCLQVLNDLLDNESDNSIDDATDKYFNDCGVPQGDVLIPASFTMHIVNIQKTELQLTVINRLAIIYFCNLIFSKTFRR